MHKIVNGEQVEMTAEEIAEFEAMQALANIPVVPRVVTMRQARLALFQAGKLATVNDAIANMAGAQGEAARIEWEFSNEVQRNQPLVLALAPLLNMTSTDLDNLFILAAGL
jgi:hypothetical protein